ncbi:MAG: hypothetical protein WCC86_03155 [Methanoregula sp.]
MKPLCLLPILIALVIVAGCAGVPSSASTQPPLTLNQQAQFAINDYAFTSGINDIQIQNNQTIIVTITVVNTGTKGMTLSVYPTFNDPVGQSFPGAAIFFSQISPNYKSTQKGTIYIPPGELEHLTQGSTLDVKYQGTSPIPFETTWSVDLSHLPS